MLFTCLFIKSCVIKSPRVLMKQINLRSAVSFLRSVIYFANYCTVFYNHKYSRKKPHKTICSTGVTILQQTFGVQLANLTICEY